MNVALGLKAHSGWAALVALADEPGGLRLVERGRLELVQPADAPWGRQPYHAAEKLEIRKGRTLVERAIDGAHGMAARELRGAVQRLASAGHRVVGCAVLVGGGMPNWTVDEILAVHFRMHKAEGELFRDALTRATRACELQLVTVPEKGLADHAASALRQPANQLLDRIAALGKAVGPPWGKDQKQAALAALIALSRAAGGAARSGTSPLC